MEEANKKQPAEPVTSPTLRQCVEPMDSALPGGNHDPYSCWGLDTPAENRPLREAMVKGAAYAGALRQLHEATAAFLGEVAKDGPTSMEWLWTGEGKDALRLRVNDALDAAYHTLQTTPGRDTTTHPDTALIDFLEAAWPVTNIDVYDGGDAFLGLSYDNGLLDGKLLDDNLRDLLQRLRERLGESSHSEGGDS